MRRLGRVTAAARHCSGFVIKRCFNDKCVASTAASDRWDHTRTALPGAVAAICEEADVGVAAVLSCFRSLKLDPQNANKKHEEMFDQAVEIVGAKKFEQQKQYVQDEVAKQVQSCFEAVLKMPKDSEKNAPKMSLSGFERNTEVEEKLGISDNFQKLFGFTLNVEKSSVPDAGEGVKLYGSASIGSLVVCSRLVVATNF
ncbi:hypothetical protein DD238_000844 [Peronospora effusa]|uniref:Uncharacterized protein n=1 Tax=Peronospora effusa TaxID=542832 RepID=A0A3M6VAG2_9STRA|nr:hypothetical protein DD238_000844 [Peronospora effusa]RQM18306.1 hypothetical protein DD237_000067 [Peronospora effusa]